MFKNTCIALLIMLSNPSYSQTGNVAGDYHLIKTAQAPTDWSLLRGAAKVTSNDGSSINISGSFEVQLGETTMLKGELTVQNGASPANGRFALLSATGSYDVTHPDGSPGRHYRITGIKVNFSS